MSRGFAIALDAMGGDKAPDMVIAAADRALHHHPHTRFLVAGDQNRIQPLLAGRPKLAAQSQILHTEQAVAGDEKPSQALRRGRTSSMRLAIDAVADGRADAVVSAGNTGALMAMGKFVLKTLPGIRRPAIASILPTERGETVVLDLGANIDCDVEDIVQFAVMGADFAHAVLGRYRPLVGLLNVGTEEVKGHDVIRAAAESLRSASDLPFDFLGFVEGNDIGAGTVDVVVTDGFTGNVALKTAEGTAKMIAHYLRASLQSSWLSLFAAVLAKPALAVFQDRLDPRFYNGGVFLGLSGIVVKSHGGTDAVGFAAAIDVAIDMVADDMIGRIKADSRRFQSPAPEPAPTTLRVS
jgi:glycerol-3-phosphate acyltransferase PlsX